MPREKIKIIDLSEILRPYENMWVALSKDNTKVIEAANTLSELFNKINGEDHRKFEFMKVPKFRNINLLMWQ